MWNIEPFKVSRRERVNDKDPLWEMKRKPKRKTFLLLYDKAKSFLLHLVIHGETKYDDQKDLWFRSLFAIQTQTISISFALTIAQVT